MLKSKNYIILDVVQKSASHTVLELKLNLVNLVGLIDFKIYGAENITHTIAVIAHIIYSLLTKRNMC